jgi:HK97 family phage major capsid protein
MEFEYLTPKAFDELSDAQQTYYLKQKRKYEDGLAKEIAEKAGTDAAKIAIDAMREEFKTTLDAQKLEIEGFKTALADAETKNEAALAEMARIKALETAVRRKSMGDAIFEELSTEKGLAMLKAAAKSKTPFSIEFNADGAIKAAGTIAKPTANGGGVAPDFIAPVSIAHEIVQARNVIPVFPTDSDTIKYVQFTRGQGGFGTVAAGAAKPQLDYVPTPQIAPVTKIAGYVTLQEEFLEDVSGAPAWLAAELPQAYLDQETYQIMKGDGSVNAGTGTGLKGLFSQWATAQTLPNGSVTTTSNNWDKIAAALAQVRVTLRATDAIWLSPSDYKELMINKGNTLEYTYPIQADFGGILSIGGVPIYQHTVFNPGEGLTGDFRRGTAIFQKKAMTMKTSTEMGNNFIQNLITVLLEGRIALPVFFPEAFIKINLTYTT